MSDPKSLTTEELHNWIDHFAVAWLKSRKPEFLVTWKRFDDERKAREQSIWNWFSH
jgi:hypothetical protein